MSQRPAPASRANEAGSPGFGMAHQHRLGCLATEACDLAAVADIVSICA